ncbi:MAG: DUF1015 domain-containing protein [Saprospiraceae bacterium]|nr:DUF1015 domain-containing protein [Saprospiraceae bacterium]
MKIKPFQAAYPKFDFIASPDSFCEDAKNSFCEFQANGFFDQSPVVAFYVYRIDSDTGSHIGLIAINEVEDFFAGKVKKHEKTLSEREQQQMQLFLRWKAILKPVLLTYPVAPDINRWLENHADRHSPLFSTHFEKDGQTHRVWAVADPADIHAVQQLFSEHVHRTYIADGHHRTTTIALLHDRFKGKKQELDFDHLFCAYFSSDQLEILDYNRVVEALSDISPTRFMVKMARIFDIEEIPEPRKPLEKHEIVMNIRKEWYNLRWKKEILDRYPPDHVVLDATLLNEFVLRDIIGIQDVRTDTRIFYVDGSKGLEGLRKTTQENDDRVGFLMHPVDFDDLMKMADTGESLPPKSTYFEPRMKSGMLVKML